MTSAIRRLPIVLCGPSGAGKSTLIKRLQEEFPGAFGFCVSHTTRKPRAGEVHGVHYYFSTKEEIEKDIQNGNFLEYANVHGNIYGTSYSAIESVSAKNQICILDIDVQGVRNCRLKQFPVAKYIFVAPPQVSELERRLRARGTETEESLKVRLGNCVTELNFAVSTWWDAWIVNDNLDVAYSQLRSIVRTLPAISSAPPIPSSLEPSVEQKENHPLPLVLCGPSGAGKTSLIKKLMEEFPDTFGFSVSHTTRAPRTGEVNGVHYHFSTPEIVEAMISEGKFIEFARVHANIYGTSYAAVDEVQKEKNKICILDIDVQGVVSCMNSGMKVGSYVFVTAPTLSDLEVRLRGRGTESEEALQRRLVNSVGELERAKTISWDSWIINDDLDRAYAQLKSVIKFIS